METPANNKEGRPRRRSEMPLPDELMLLILSHLTLKEVARTSLVSRNWLGYWRHFPVLNLDNPAVIRKMVGPEIYSKRFPVYWRLISQERRDFVNLVDNILDKHLSTIIDEFSVTFYLDTDHQTNIDRWVVWALSKHVQRLKLDFTKPRATFIIDDEEKRHYALHKPLVDYCDKLVLTSLCLKSVNVSNQFVEQLFGSCGSILENLWIENSLPLTSIKTNSNASLSSLRFLTLCYCNDLDTVDIDAPKLESLTYETGCKHEFKLFRIANACSLSHVLLHAPYEDHFFYVLRSLSNYFPQFVDLTLNWYLRSKTNTDPVVDYFPELAKLKHLTMYVHGSPNRNMAGWVPFIQACPLLEKLTMKLRVWFFPLSPKNIKWNKHLIHLRTFEILDFNGANVDVDVATFVLENATSLQEVIFQGSENVNIRGALSCLKLKIPESVKVR